MKKCIDSSRITQLLRQAIEWREGIAAGTIKGWMEFPHPVYQWELDAVCAAANDIFQEAGSPLRVGNYMGELIPGTALQRELQLT